MKSPAGMTVFVFGICTLAANLVIGQAYDPFGTESQLGSTADFNAQSTIPTSASASSTDDHPVVQSLRADPPKTAVELGRAILYLSRIEKWHEVRAYLDRLSKLSPNPATAQAIVRSTGLETWMGLENRTEDLSQEYRNFIRKLINDASEASRVPAVLEASVKNLESKQPVDRKRAGLTVVGAGEPGLQILFQTIANSSNLPPKIASEIVQSMGETGREAMLAAFSHTEPKALERFAVLASRIPGNEYILPLSAAIYLVDPKTEAYGELLKVLSPSGQPLVPVESVHRHLEAEIDKRLREYRQLSLEDLPSTQVIWRWSNTQSMLAENGDQADWLLEQAYRLSAIDVRLPNTFSGNLAAAAILERNYQQRPTFESEPSELRDQLRQAGLLGPTNSLPSSLPSVWDCASRYRLAGAQLRLVQALSLAGKLQVESDGRNFQVIIDQGLAHSNMAIRLATAMVVRNAPIGYFGSVDRLGMQRVIEEANQLTAKAMVAVIGGVRERRDALRSQLSQIGLQSTEFTNARESLQWVQKPNVAEFIVIVDRVLEMSISELMQRLRAHPRAANLPIVIMVPDLRESERALIDSTIQNGVLYAPLSTNLNLTAEIFRQLQEKRRAPSLDTIDRLTILSHFEKASQP